MMKPLLIIVLSVFTFTAFGQNDSLGFTNKAEAKNLMVNGLKEGKWLEYINRCDTGIFIVPEINAKYYRLTIYKASKLDGVVREYYTKGGILKIESPYREGVENGVEKWYDKNGKIYIEAPYIEGLQSGIEKFYNTNGVVVEETPFVNGMRNGIERLYYANGAIEIETPYTNDTVGLVKMYHRNGTLDCEFQWGGNGMLREYYRNGKMKSELFNAENKQDKILRKYTRLGKMKSETIYINGTN